MVLKIHFRHSNIMMKRLLILLCCLGNAAFVTAGDSPPIKFVLTYPSTLRSSRPFEFHLVLFEHPSYKLPVNFTATLSGEGLKDRVIEKFTQQSYGLQKHGFKDFKARLIGNHGSPKVDISFEPTSLIDDQGVEIGLAQILADQLAFVQTDKPIYKPGQNVKLRVLLLDRQLKAVYVNISVKVQDAKGKMVHHWKSPGLRRGLFAANFNLSDLAAEGDWAIEVEGGDELQKTTKKFKVERYILPKFDVKVEIPDNYWRFSANESLYRGFVRAKYTFGKSVQGKATVKLSGSCESEKSGSEPSFSLEKRLELTGSGSKYDGSFELDGLNSALKAERPFDLSKFQFKQCQLTFDATVTDSLTGEQLNTTTSKRISIYKHAIALKLFNSENKANSLTMRFQLTAPDGSALNNEKANRLNVKVIYLTRSVSSCSDSVKLDDPDLLNMETYSLKPNADGLAPLKVNPAEGVKSVVFLVSVAGIPSISLCEVRSPAALSIRTSKDQKSVQVGSKIKFKISASYKVSYVYVLLSQGGHVFDYRKLDHPSSEAKTQFEFELRVPSAASPRFSALVWTIEPSTSEILTDSIDFVVGDVMGLDALFRPSPTVRPGGDVSLYVKTGEPNSTVALLAVDKSVRLLRGDNDISLADVVSAISKSSSTSQQNVNDVFDEAGLVIRYKPYVEEYCQYCESDVVGGMLDYAEDADVPERQEVQRQTTSVTPKRQSPARNPKQQQPAPVVRKDFPETWIWQIVDTNSEGEWSSHFTVPDSITSWSLSALAVGDKSGFAALVSPVELTVFQDFFVSLDIRQLKVIRGEQFEIKAAVFNYQESDELNVVVTLEQSLDFDISVDDGQTFNSNTNFTKTVRVPANGGASLPIWIKLRSLGKVSFKLSGVAVDDTSSADAVRKEIDVEAEGEVRYANKPVLVRLRSDSKQQSFSLNANELFSDAAGLIVDGSKFFQLQVIGDALGPALSNLGGQIRMPYGCGEQTMITLAPNVYIHKYLKSSDVLTSDIEAKAVHFINEGYRRELTFQHEDGGFSAFGQSDKYSSTWLTAFVLRCFHAAAKHVGTTIDEVVLAKAWGHLKRMAKSDGSFNDPGLVIHTDMQGGSAGDLNLAIYIYTTFAESGASSDRAWSSLKNTRDLIIEKSTASSNSDAYQLALAAYALSILPDEKAISVSIVKRLIAMANSTEDDRMYWEKPSNLKVETAGYALLAMVNHGRIDDALKVSRWLISQRNSLGGFSSTQDTVIGLQALAESALLLFSKETDLSIRATFNFDDGKEILATEFHVDHNNALVLQSFDPDRKRQSLRSVDVSCKGNGVALVQLAARFNVEDRNKLDSGDFSLEVNNHKQSGSDKTIRLETCVSSLTEGAKHAGMVVLELGIPTGFDLNLAATKEQLGQSTSVVKRIEAGDRKLVYYFDSLSDGRICVEGIIDRVFSASNVQAPMARIYAYYTPTMFKATSYSFEGMAGIVQA